MIDPLIVGLVIFGIGMGASAGLMSLAYSSGVRQRRELQKLNLALSLDLEKAQTEADAWEKEAKHTAKMLSSCRTSRAVLQRAIEDVSGVRWRKA